MPSRRRSDSGSRSRSRDRKKDKDRRRRDDSRGDRRGGGRDRRSSKGGSLDDWIDENDLDDKCANLLRSLDSSIQKGVMDMGNCHDCRNPSAVVMSRIRKLEGEAKGSGRGRSPKGGGGGRRGRSDSRRR
eukprot:TRINITY_DN76738_c0_g1_i1.p1 TRINITY_DN76738_c0_g1~~TRINITY_DN76738_c0_g1_i1.p1  ORF type:complete len:130 (-),score=16.60 TRINITY_DN76738_c0_g1_i1:79-468(-)